MPLQQFPDGFDAGRFLGRVYPHAPHRDAEYTAPVRSVSYWAAVGPVRAENSMAIYPASDAEHEPIVPVCSAGDVVVFADRTLHATIPNFTDETRVVVSFRTAPGRFLRFGAGTNFHPYVDARLMGTPFAGVSRLQSYCTAAAVRSWWSQHRPRRARVERTAIGCPDCRPPPTG
jgi:ectoine hydroxylase-related dioxygenase (phytanoyl-CoA dioxygenase family)